MHSNYPQQAIFRFTIIKLSSRTILILLLFFDMITLGTRIALICYRSK